MSENAKPIPIEIDLEKFYAKIEKTESCWIWRGARSRGYGYFGIGKSIFRAHRVSFFLKHGRIDSKKIIDHICKNKSCVNPEHLREVSQRCNVIENSNCVTAANSKKTHCKRGHEFTLDNIYKIGRNGRSCKECTRIKNKEWKLKLKKKREGNNL